VICFDFNRNGVEGKYQPMDQGACCRKLGFRQQEGADGLFLKDLSQNYRIKSLRNQTASCLVSNPRMDGLKGEAGAACAAG
jgi:hypothetical protein